MKSVFYVNYLTTSIINTKYKIFIPAHCILYNEANRFGCVVCRACGLWLGPNVLVRLAAGKNFYLWLITEKIHASAVFSVKIYGHKIAATKFYKFIKFFY